MEKVLFVIKNSMLTRGMNTGLENLAWGLSERGIEVHILSGGVLPKKCNYTVPKNVYYYFSGKNGENPINFMGLFSEIIDKNKFKVVIGWIINISPLISIASRQNIVFISNQGQIAPKILYVNFLKKILLRKIPVLDAIKLLLLVHNYASKLDKIISISSAVQSSCIETYKLDLSKCEIIPRGVDTNKYSFEGRKAQNEKFIVLYAGNIQPTKGINDLVNSLKFIDKSVKIVLCGNGNIRYINKLASKVARYNKGHELEFTGPLKQEQLITQFKNCDFFVFPSHSEGLGKALIEAMSCGCPVICSDISPFTEIVTQNYSGLIAKKKSPKSLGEAINTYIADNELRIQCGLYGREVVEKNFSKELEIEKWYALINSFRI
ncbi:glycosyltransferase family 4 protein [Paenibacillus sp. IB182496]|uniref:Glycosyltransferase family 4 protein n=1 Tax=Paenibacillus sabuli TaxID=2772509 RepID=A0A927BXS1_9BACL|nr:glycosyltransferase family 4 protein [Paenibacillus sabuli]MBD2847555.1 glycosyltransferase family 4 protein [Paenibacillus sabuli]